MCRTTSSGGEGVPEPIRVGWLLAAAAEVPTAGPAGDAWLAPGERRHLDELRFAGRRADWRLGRWAAKRALAAWLELAWRPATGEQLEIRARADGAPEAHRGGRPLPTVISLSHRAGTALAAVAPASAGTALGCDLERVEPRSAAFVHDYLTAGERAWVAAAPEAARALRANLVWSAKESALKALGTGLRRDTRSVEVRVGEENGGANDGAEDDTDGWRPLTVVAVPAGPAFAGWWRRQGDLLATVVALPRPAPPIRLG